MRIAEFNDVSRPWNVVGYDFPRVGWLSEPSARFDRIEAVAEGWDVENGAFHFNEEGGGGGIGGIVAGNVFAPVVEAVEVGVGLRSDHRMEFSF